ncbi:MAG: hypothetical protein DSY58_04765 [Desulfobulbus sp.]|nr:MAG: hypothetical protein DSY58_04765 [Desulfobulbus sp.]
MSFPFRLADLLPNATDIQPAFRTEHIVLLPDKVICAKPDFMSFRHLPKSKTGSRFIRAAGKPLFSLFT